MSASFIPDMTDHMGRHWRQPAGLNSRVVADDCNALIAPQDLLALPEYSSTIPTGVYPGKAWRAEYPDGVFLCWYGEDIGGKCKIEVRRVLQ